MIASGADAAGPGSLEGGRCSALWCGVECRREVCPSVGCDLVSIAEVQRALDRYGGRYRRRIFSTGELAAGSATMGAEGVAARFAAKEAVLKALEPANKEICWGDIEIVRREGGACAVALHGEARQLADRRGFDRWSLSMCHEGSVAVAVAVASGGRGARCSRA